MKKTNKENQGLKRCLLSKPFKNNPILTFFTAQHQFKESKEKSGSCSAIVWSAAPITAIVVLYQLADFFFVLEKTDSFEII